MNPTLSLLLAALLVTGCASTDKIILDTTKRKPTTTLQVFKDGEKPAKPFKEIAEQSFLGARQDEFKALRHFIEEAKQMGADAIIFVVPERGNVHGDAFGVSTSFVFKSTAIVYEQK
jgi:type IV pilus biogenesis protein CpaD/CtpE